MLWLVKILYFPEDSTDYLGIFLIAVLGFWLLYNFYLLVLYKFFPTNGKWKFLAELLFTVLVIVPIPLAFLCVFLITLNIAV